MERVFIFSFFLFMAAFVNGQNESVFPCMDLGDEIPQLEIYNHKLDSIIDETLHDDFICRYHKTPSSDFEYLFQVCKVDSLDFIIEGISFQIGLFSDYDSVFYFKKSITYDEVCEIEEMFEIITSNIQNNKIVGMDEGGVSYTFYHNNGSEIRCGEVWYVAKHTYLEKVVARCNHLIELTIRNNI